MTRDAVVRSLRTAILAVAAAAAVCAASGLARAADGPLQAGERIVLPDVTGRLDHMALDAAGERLFLAALGNGSLEVVDLREGKWIRRISGLEEPQGVVCTGDPARVLVSEGGSGVCTAYDASTLEPVARIDLGEDADNLRTEGGGGHVLVGYGSGAIGELDGSLHEVASVPMPGHPEAFALGDDGRIFVNVPAMRAVVVADLEHRRTLDTWKLDGTAGNFPMALDAANHLLLVGARDPARLEEFDTRSGHVAATAPLDRDPDDIFLDPANGRIYVSCGEGAVDVLERTEDGRLRETAKVPTSPGARTSLFDPVTRRLYVAAPRRGADAAAIWTFTAR